MIRTFLSVLLAAAGLQLSPAAAQVRLDGWLVASAACSATRKKDRDNPGAVRLEVGRAYALRARNGTPGSHYRIVVPGAPVIAERWVRMECGVVRKEAGRPGPDTPDRRGPRAESNRLEPDSIENVLAVSWSPGFCLANPRRPECRSITADRFDASHFSLHGLWPDDLHDDAIFPCYCDAGAPRSCARNLAPVRRIELADTIAAQLRKAMPGVRSRLHLHQWTKHGSCYEDDRSGPDRGADPDEYFDEALALLDQVNRSPVRTLFLEHRGRTLEAARIAAVFDRSFGAGAGARVVLRCGTAQGQPVITELWIRLGSGITSLSRLGPLMLAAPPATAATRRRACGSGIVAEPPQGG